MPINSWLASYPNRKLLILLPLQEIAEAHKECCKGKNTYIFFAYNRDFKDCEKGRHTIFPVVQK